MDGDVKTDSGSENDNEVVMVASEELDELGNDMLVYKFNLFGPPQNSV